MTDRATSGSPTSSPTNPGRAALPIAAAAALVNAAVHLYLVPAHLAEQLYIGLLFLVGGLLLLTAVAGMVWRDDRRAWALGALISAGMLVGGVLSRTTGLPAYREAAWEPLLLVSFAVELVFLAAWAVRERARR